MSSWSNQQHGYGVLVNQCSYLHKTVTFISFNHYVRVSAVELAYGNVLCFQCGDYVYDSELAEVASVNQIKAAASLGVSSVYTPWNPTLREVQLLQTNPQLRTILKESTIGIRQVTIFKIYNSLKPTKSYIADFKQN